MTTADELARWLEAERLPDVVVSVSAGGEVPVPRLLRREVRSPDTIDKAKSCWAPNKPALAFDGGVMWAEFVIVRLLERNGWEARWMKNWVGGREACVAVGRSEPLPREAAAMLRRIDGRAAIASGGGAWDIFAWRGDSYLCIESKQHRSGDKLRPTQIAWLEAATAEGVGTFAIVEYDAQRLDVSSRPARRAARRSSVAREVDGVPTDPRLQALLDEAAAAEPADRITHRDQIAAHGQAAIAPLLGWISSGRHPAFAVKVLEAIGADHPQEAKAALSRARTSDPSVAAMATDALHRLGPISPKPRPKPSGRGGVLDATYAAKAPPGRACEWLTRQGRPCQNPANYLVQGKWSCSRDHRP
jgi:hypothetical protein